MTDPAVNHVNRIPASPERRRLVGQIALATRHGETERVTELRRDLKAQTLEDHIKALVDTAPALTNEQRERLALLFWSGDQR
jgi:hypothetical protein